MFRLRIFQLRKYSSGGCKYKPLPDEDRIFTNLYGRHDWNLKAAMCRGDWYKTREIIKKGPAWIINQLHESGMRGRGGAGFPVGKKLKYMQSIKVDKPKYVVVNGAEGEVGTCKDRDIMRHEPQKLIEGTLLVGRAISAKAAVIFVRGRFFNEACCLQMAITEAYEAGLLGSNACGSGFDFDIFVQRGGGKYICGEETALINCLSGKVGRPHKKPPFPTEKGIYDMPTTLLNAETISVVPTICRRGSKWFASLGSEPYSTGTKLFNISGHVENPCTVEERLGIPFRELVERHAGGVRGGWNNLLAVIPGGTSTTMIHKDNCNNLKLDFESLKKANSSLGTGAVIVMDKSHDIFEAVRRILLFYKKGSCHQCTKCRDQSMWAYEYIERFIIGNAQPHDIDWLYDITKWAEGNAICGLVDANAYAIQGFLKHFRRDIEERLHKYARS